LSSPVCGLGEIEIYKYNNQNNVGLKKKDDPSKATDVTTSRIPHLRPRGTGGVASPPEGGDDCGDLPADLPSKDDERGGLDDNNRRRAPQNGGHKPREGAPARS